MKIERTCKESKINVAVQILNGILPSPRTASPIRTAAGTAGAKLAASASNAGCAAGCRVRRTARGVQQAPHEQSSLPAVTNRIRVDRRSLEELWAVEAVGRIRPQVAETLPVVRTAD